MPSTPQVPEGAHPTAFPAPCPPPAVLWCPHGPPPGSAASPAFRTLTAGACEWLQLPRGARLCLVEGRLRLLEPAQWIADTWYQPEQWLGAGEVHTSQQAGWARLEADAACRFLVLPAPGWAARWQAMALRGASVTARLAGWLAARVARLSHGA